MLDDIREWISDNLRWILLGLSAILVVVIIVVAIRLVRNISSGSGTQKESQSAAAEQTGSKTADEDETAAGSQSEDAASSGSSEALTKDQADVLAAAKSYWSAIENSDFDTLEALCGKTYDDAARAKIQKMDVAVESYSDIRTYSKPGLTNGSYVVYVYMELNLTGIETQAPRLSDLYMEPDSDGSLKVITSDDYTSEIEAYVASCTADDDVQALVKEVNDTLAERCEKDADLNRYVESVSQKNADESGEEDTDSTESSTESTASDAATGTMKVSVDGGANVRSEASTDGTLVASLVKGATVEVLENLDNGWSRIQFINSSGSTVEGYMMTQFLSQ